MRMTVECASHDDSLFMFTCVHLHPKWIEACDNSQMVRYKTKIGISAPALVRSESIKHVYTLDVTEFSETNAWVHFKNPAGVVISCRKFIAEFLDLALGLNVEGGTRVVLPKSLILSAERADIFSVESDSKKVLVDLRPGKLAVTGEGASGYYRESKKIDYTGPAFSFLISAKLLKDICTRHNECEMTGSKLKVIGERFTYVACLREVKTEKQE